jgi:hypothetical protein
MTRCPACGHTGPSDGPAHAYMSPSPACWARYGEVLAREYSDRDYWKAHRLLTDAYCGQHSISMDRRARQSLYIHLSALMLHFEDALSESRIVTFLRAAAKSGHDFPYLEMPPANQQVRIDGVYGAADAAQHLVSVTDFARGVFAAWASHHGAFRKLIREVGA